MRKSWPFAVAVIVVGGLAGLAIAGLPESSDAFRLDPSITVVVDSAPPSDQSTATTTVDTTTTIATTTTPPTTTEPTTTSAADAPTTTTAATTTQQSTTAVSGPLPRDQVALVIANGDGRFRLASITADRLSPLGYVINLSDALKPVDETIIYYRPGFDDEAAIVAKDILVPGAVITAFPTDASQAITNSDDGDVIIVLGPDAPR
jgi:hypothetical protein